MSIWKGHRPEIGECPFISWSYLVVGVQAPFVQERGYGRRVAQHIVGVGCKANATPVHRPLARKMALENAQVVLRCLAFSGMKDRETMPTKGQRYQRGGGGMAEGPDEKRYPSIKVNKEAMASLVGRYMQYSDFRTAVRNAKNDRSLRDLLKKAGYGVPSELTEKELEAVLDFHRHTVRKGWSDERICEELIGSPVDDDVTHLRG